MPVKIPGYCFCELVWYEKYRMGLCVWFDYRDRYDHCHWQGLYSAVVKLVGGSVADAESTGGIVGRKEFSLFFRKS